MCTPCVHHEELMSLDIIPNPNSSSRLLLILLDCSRLYHMTSRSHAYLLSLFCCRLIIIILNPNPSPSLSTHSSYNSKHAMIQRREELSDIKCNNTCFKTLGPANSYQISQKYTSILSGPLGIIF